MGFLFSLERVRGDAIPTLNAFPILRDEIMRELRACPAIVAGSVYGSSMRGDVSTRSDMDMFLVYETAERNRVSHMLRRLGDRARSVHISLHASIHSVDAAARTDRYGPSFRETWERMRTKGLLIGEPECYYRALFPYDVQSEMSNKIHRYVGKVRRQQRQFAELPRTRGWLDRQLERWYADSVRPAHVYVNVARWLLLWRDGTLGDDGKHSVTRRLLASSEFTSVHETFEGIRDLDGGYNQLLRKMRRGEISGAEYSHGVRTLLNALLPANVFLLTEAHRLTVGNLNPIVIAA